jgi:magnesium-protoporphyrin O-methyltransferase
MDIRKGHAQTVEKVLNWVDEEGSLEGISVCDAGCGTGG